jgi:hypothetical protein
MTEELKATTGKPANFPHLSPLNLPPLPPLNLPPLPPLNLPFRDLIEGIGKSISNAILPPNRTAVTKIRIWKLPLFYYQATLYRENKNIRSAYGLTPNAARRRAHIQHAVRNLQSIIYVITCGFMLGQISDVILHKPGWPLSAVNLACYLVLLVAIHSGARSMAKTSIKTNKDPR